MQMPELLKRPKLGCREPVTECRVFTEEGPLLSEIWLASSFHSFFTAIPWSDVLEGLQKRTL